MERPFIDQKLINASKPDLGLGSQKLRIITDKWNKLIRDLRRCADRVVNRDPA